MDTSNLPSRRSLLKTAPNTPFLRPAGCPIGIDPTRWRKAVLDRIEQHADALALLINALDQMDGDRL